MSMTIPNEQRKKIEEMANGYAYPSVCMLFAEAAWRLATEAKEAEVRMLEAKIAAIECTWNIEKNDAVSEAVKCERERCATVVSKNSSTHSSGHIVWDNDPNGVVKEILNPQEGGGE